MLPVEFWYWHGVSLVYQHMSICMTDLFLESSLYQASLSLAD